MAPWHRGRRLKGYSRDGFPQWRPGATRAAFGAAVPGTDGSPGAPAVICGDFMYCHWPHWPHTRNTMEIPWSATMLAANQQISVKIARSCGGENPWLPFGARRS